MIAKFRLDDEVEILKGHVLFSCENGKCGYIDARPERVGKIALIKRIKKQENREYGPGFEYTLEIDGNEISWFPEEHLKLHKKRS